MIKNSLNQNDRRSRNQPIELQDKDLNSTINPNSTKFKQPDFLEVDGTALESPVELLEANDNSIQIMSEQFISFGEDSYTSDAKPIFN